MSIWLGWFMMGFELSLDLRGKNRLDHWVSIIDMG